MSRIQKGVISFEPLRVANTAMTLELLSDVIVCQCEPIEHVDFQVFWRPKSGRSGVGGWGVGGGCMRGWPTKFLFSIKNIFHKFFVHYFFFLLLNVYTHYGDIRHNYLNILSMVDNDKIMNSSTAITTHIHTRLHMH